MRLLVDKNEYTIYDPTIFQAEERGNNMYREEYGHYSWILDKDMRIIIYGQSGMPFLCFPTQNSMSNNYEDFGMIDQLADFIEDGRIQLFAVDSVDVESWSLSEVTRSGAPLVRSSIFTILSMKSFPSCATATTRHLLSQASVWAQTMH